MMLNSIELYLELCNRLPYHLICDLGEPLGDKLLVGLVGSSAYFSDGVSNPIIKSVYHDRIIPYFRTLSSITDTEVMNLIQVSLRARSTAELDITKFEDLSKSGDEWKAKLLVRKSDTEYRLETSYGLYPEALRSITDSEATWLDSRGFDRKSWIKTGKAIGITESYDNFRKLYQLND